MKRNPRRKNTEPSGGKSAATRRHIYETALRLFQKNGFEETTMRQVAKEAGVALGGAYYYFASKDEEVFLAREMAHPRQHSDETARIIDDEIRRIVTTSMHQAEVLLRENIEMLHKTSKVLLEREILDAEELDMIMRGEELPPSTREKRVPYGTAKNGANGVAPSDDAATDTAQDVSVKPEITPPTV